MVVVSDRFRDMEPRLVRRDCGGWLAVSQNDAPINIATIGLTADDARLRFQKEVEAWSRLLDEPRQEPT